MGPFVVPTRMNGKITFWNHPLKSYNRNLIDVINSTGVCQVFTSPVSAPCPKHDMFFEKEEAQAPPHPMKNMLYSISKPKTNYETFPPATPAIPSSPSYFNTPTTHNVHVVMSEMLPYDLSMNDITNMDSASMMGSLHLAPSSPSSPPMTSPPMVPSTPPIPTPIAPTLLSPSLSSPQVSPPLLHNDLDSLLISVGLSHLAEKMKSESLTLDVLLDIPKEDFISMLRLLPMTLGEAIKIHYAIKKMKGNESQSKKSQE